MILPLGTMKKKMNVGFMEQSRVHKRVHRQEFTNREQKQRTNMSITRKS